MLKGCDISHHQGNVNFLPLKNDGIDFAIIRSTYGDGYTDREFAVNRDKVRQVGLLTGFYHYSYPQYNSPYAEADWFTSIVQPLQTGEIIVLDFEENYDDPVGWCKTWLDRVQGNTGQKPYLYINLNLNNTNDWTPVVDAGYPIWLARWDYNPVAPAPPTDWDKVWLRQFANNGDVGGISPLDLNTFYGTKTEYMALGKRPDGLPVPPDPTPLPPDDLITPDQYFGKYDQKYLDFDGAFGAQCMDNYRYFVKESLGFPQSPLVVGAYQVWDSYLTDYYDRIENTPTNAPIKGDIVIWGQELGRFGHIAVCKDGTPTEFNSFDQNYPTGSPCHFQHHSYYAVLGWIRKKEPNQPPDPIPPDPIPPDPPAPCVKCCDDWTWKQHLKEAYSLFTGSKNS